jgi:hypothetical protein
MKYLKRGMRGYDSNGDGVGVIAFQPSRQLILAYSHIAGFRIRSNTVAM